MSDFQLALMVMLHLEHLLLRGQHNVDLKITVHVDAEKRTNSAHFFHAGLFGRGRKNVLDRGFRNAGGVRYILHGIAHPIFSLCAKVS